ncbi:hypothetical protein GCM10025857_17670 [Alicyclobacillus contaminans]|uniref:hypothetical protein n=1 Tax=Alicyclobacillus contaminans TaxID=392016 RepID=UPI0004223367|nr:hypothetical protein [Alicyclobacillus contaminans]GMA50410.1 hypothetical protein GCM10025857_17670 [Alicyclobacillus contaminans]
MEFLVIFVAAVVIVGALVIFMNVRAIQRENQAKRVRQSEAAAELQAPGNETGRLPAHARPIEGTPTPNGRMAAEPEQASRKEQVFSRSRQVSANTEGEALTPDLKRPNPVTEDVYESSDAAYRAALREALQGKRELGGRTPDLREDEIWTEDERYRAALRSMLNQRDE